MTTLTTAPKRPRPAALAARPPAALDHDARCACGQELDCCASAYCPRCGHAVERTPDA